MTTEPPESHRDLLERPLFAHLATLRPDGSPQSSVMWFAWDGNRVLFSHTSTRQKYRNLLREGRVSFHIQDPEPPYRTLEVRGHVESMDPDPTRRSIAASRTATTSFTQSWTLMSELSLW